MSNKLTTTDIITQFKNIHKDKYDYSKVNYINAKSKVIIICPLHGKFYQTPDKHKQGQNCFECSKITNGNNKRSNLNSFIEKAKLIYPEYNYDNVIYKSSSDKIKVNCKYHNEFITTPNRLLSKHGCPKCMGKFKTTDEFVNECSILHKNRYTYNKTIYTNSTNKLIVTCKVHGDFSITPYHHLTLEGCPKCSYSKGEDIIMNYLDSNNIPYNSQYNINYSNRKFILDFYIPEFNIFIEYNGKQHYEYIPFFHKGGIIDFEKQINRDNLLKKYCKENNILLIELSYKLNKEEIFTILKNTIC